MTAAMRPLLLLSVLLAAACARTAPSGPAAGKAYFVQAGCSSCHKIGDEGSAAGPDLTLVGFRQSPAWLDLFIKDPQAWKKDTLMPNKRVSDEARAAMVAYLSGLKGQDWPKGSRPWDAPSLIKDPVARGRVIYGRAGCAGCHGLAGEGGYPNNNVKGGLIPPVSKVKDGFSKAELVAKLRMGVPRSQKADERGPEPMIRMPAWGEILDDAELDALAEYLFSLAPAGAKADF